MQVLDQIQRMQTHLQLHAATMSSEEWNDCTKQIGDLKNDFSMLIRPLESGEVLNHLRMTIEQRRRERSRQAQTRRATHEMAAWVRKDMKKEHERIDRWLEHGKDQAERAKMVGPN